MPFILPCPFFFSSSLFWGDRLELEPRPETTFLSPVISHTCLNLASKLIHFFLPLLIVCWEVAGLATCQVSGGHSIWVNGKSKHRGGLGKQLSQ